MCETPDLGIKWPQWYTLLFEEQVAVDMRVVCPQDVKKMLLKQGRMVYWKTWAAKLESGVEGRSVAAANPSFAAKKDKLKRGQTSTDM